MQLVLSLFPGIDLLGRGFESEGFCVVRGPDRIYGMDIRNFHCPFKRFDGIIGGPPCQDFSGLNREPGEEGIEMLREYLRVVNEAQPDWFLLENVARVPDVSIAGYDIQRFDLNARECGLRQRRLRHFQFGSSKGLVLVPERSKPLPGPIEPICLASEGSQPNRRTWKDFCSLQGLEPIDLPGMSIEARYRAVGNGVPLPMAIVVARAIKEARFFSDSVHLCRCGCGRIVSGNQLMATPACRKRMQRKRDSAIAKETWSVTM